MADLSLDRFPMFLSLDRFPWLSLWYVAQCDSEASRSGQNVC